MLEKALLPFMSTDACKETAEKTPVTKLDFYLDGLSGGKNSKALREALLKELDLPCDMSADALIEAINLLYSLEEYKEKLEKIKSPAECSGCKWKEFCQRCPGTLCAESSDPEKISDNLCDMARKLHEIYTQKKEK